MTPPESLPTRVISICGPSCVGKGTLISKLYQKDPQAWERFGIESTPHFYASRQKTRDGIVPYEPLEKMFLPPSPSIIVFRWQYIEHDWIHQLKQAFPDASHEIILLWRPWHLMANDSSRVLKKRRTAGTEKDHWRKKILTKFGPGSSLALSNTPISICDATSAIYSAIDWPDCTSASGFKRGVPSNLIPFLSKKSADRSGS